MKIVIIGDGKVGHELAKQLSELAYDIVVIDNKASVLKKSINDLDINCVGGNGVSSEIQKEAGVPESDLVIACTSTDETNMLCCLIARKLGAKQTVARVRNPVYYQQMDLIKEDLGLSMSVNPDFALAEEIARVLIFPAAVKVETLVKGRVELVELKVNAAACIVGLSLAEIYRKFQIKILVCAVQRGTEVIIPDGRFVIQADDNIHIAAVHNEIKKFFKLIGQYRDKVRTVMICGGSRAAYYLSKKLVSLGMDVRIIEKDKDRSMELCDMLPRATIINGDAAEHELLLEEGLDKVDAFLALTGMDEENIIMSLYAKTIGVQKIVTKINNDALLNITDQLGLDSVVSPKNLTANTIISYVRALQNSLTNDNVQTMYQLLDDKIEALEFIIKKNAYYVGTSLAELNVREGVLIAYIVRGRQIIIPSGRDEIHVGDSVVIVTKVRNVQDLEEIITPPKGYDYEL